MLKNSFMDQIQVAFISKKGILVGTQISNYLDLEYTYVSSDNLPLKSIHYNEKYNDEMICIQNPKISIKEIKIVGSTISEVIV